MTSTERAMSLLAAGVPLTLLIDLALVAEVNQLELPSPDAAFYELHLAAALDMAV